MVKLRQTKQSAPCEQCGGQCQTGAVLTDGAAHMVCSARCAEQLVSAFSVHAAAESVRDAAAAQVDAAKQQYSSAKRMAPCYECGRMCSTGSKLPDGRMMAVCSNECLDQIQHAALQKHIAQDGGSTAAVDAAKEAAGAVGDVAKRAASATKDKAADAASAAKEKAGAAAKKGKEKAGEAAKKARKKLRSLSPKRKKKEEKSSSSEDDDKADEEEKASASQSSDASSESAATSSAAATTDASASTSSSTSEAAASAETKKEAATDATAKASAEQEAEKKAVRAAESEWLALNRQLWDDHVWGTREVINTTLSNAASGPAALDRLLNRNQTDIAVRAVGSLLQNVEAARELEDLLKEHIEGAARILTEAKALGVALTNSLDIVRQGVFLNRVDLRPQRSRDAIAAVYSALSGNTITADDLKPFAALLEAIQDWYTNGESIANFLGDIDADALPENALETAMNVHLGQTIWEALYFAAGDYVKALEQFDQARVHILRMSDTIATGVWRVAEKAGGRRALISGTERAVDAIKKAHADEYRFETESEAKDKYAL